MYETGFVPFVAVLENYVIQLTRGTKRDVSSLQISFTRSNEKNPNDVRSLPSYNVNYKQEGPEALNRTPEYTGNNRTFNFKI